MNTHDWQIVWAVVAVLAVLLMIGLIVQMYATPHPWCGFDGTC